MKSPVVVWVKYAADWRESAVSVRDCMLLQRKGEGFGETKDVDTARVP